jgi:hypothetical protein
MNLLVRAVAAALADIAKAKHLENARVDWKTNKRGELVIAIIVDHDPVRAHVPGIGGCVHSSRQFGLSDVKYCAPGHVCKHAT